MALHKLQIQTLLPSKSQALAASSSTMPVLQEEIVGEILHRLPVKLLLRFRSVSKLWRSLIDGKQFAQLHLRQSLSSNSNLTLLVDSMQLYCVDLDSFKLLEIGDARIEPYSVAATCDGLVLIVRRSGDVYLWNLATRKGRILPAVPPVSDRMNCFKYVQSFFSLGYDSEHDDYKVVRVYQAEHDDGFSTETAIYSLKANSWKTVNDFPYSLPYHVSKWGVYLNGALHTVVKYCSKHVVAMMAFDLGKEEHREPPMPPYRRAGAELNLFYADKMGGCLAGVITNGERNEIWLMNEYGVKQSWVKLLRVDPLIPELRPFVLSANDEEVLLNNAGHYLYRYEFRKKGCTIACLSGFISSFDRTALGPFVAAEVCVGSLVSPFSPAEKEAHKHK